MALKECGLLPSCSESWELWALHRTGEPGLCDASETNTLSVDLSCTGQRGLLKSHPLYSSLIPYSWMCYRVEYERSTSFISWGLRSQRWQKWGWTCQQSFLRILQLDIAQERIWRLDHYLTDFLHPFILKVKTWMATLFAVTQGLPWVST